MKKWISMALSLLMILGSFVIPVNAKTSIDGTFKTVTLESGQKVYTYTASKLNDPTPMMTPIIFVYNNEGYKNEEVAKDYLIQNGLNELAENEKGLVLLMNPVEKAWSSSDVDVYWEVVDQLATSDNPFVLSYSNMIYAMGENDGSSFIHNDLSKNANRIAAVLTVGGNATNLKEEMDLPAYLVNASKDVVDYYKEVNDTNEKTSLAGKTCYYDSSLDVKKVIVDDTKATSLTKDIVFEGWNLLLRRTVRNAIETCIFGANPTDPITREVFRLQKRVVAKEEGLIFNNVDYVTETSGYFEWIPKEALEEDNDQLYPMVVTIQGSGDHPVFKAESMGWIEVAAKERVIILAPATTNADTNKALIDEMIEKYPVDPSRIYATGFSGGGVGTSSIAKAYPETFAAIAPMSSFGHAWGSNMGLEFSDETCAKIDLPIFYASGMNDDLIAFPGVMGDAGLTADQYAGNKYIDPGLISGYVNAAIKINELGEQVNADVNALDFNKYPFIGFDTAAYGAKYEKIKTPHGIVMHTYSYDNQEGITMFKHTTVETLNHNHYTYWAPNMIWDFFDNFKRDQDTLKIIYVDDNVEETPSQPVTPDTPVKTGDNSAVMMFAMSSLLAATIYVSMRKEENI